MPLKAESLFNMYMRIACSCFQRKRIASAFTKVEMFETTRYVKQTYPGVPGASGGHGASYKNLLSPRACGTAGLS